MNKELKQVEDFMTAFGQPVRYSPVTEIPSEEALLRLHLIEEEFKELCAAFGVQHLGPNMSYSDPMKRIDIVESLDALTDLLYVIYGTYHSLGLSRVAEAAFEEVQKSNMSKLQPDGTVKRRSDGKVLKGPNFFKPNLTQFVK